MRRYQVFCRPLTTIAILFVIACPLFFTKIAHASIQNDRDIAINLKNATNYMNKARDTGDDRFYALAESSLDKVFKIDPGNYGALRVKAWVQSGRHQFNDALATAKRASSIQPGDSSNYGVMVDALVELGCYDKAIVAAQRMVDLKPGMSSYSRIAYLRWFYGDSEGAQEMMKMAVEAGPPNSSATNWCIVQLGNEYFKQGKLDMAKDQYKRALTIDPSYVHALAAMGKVESAKQNYTTAIEYYQKAIAKNPVHAYVVALGDLYEITGDKKRAQEEFSLVEKMAAARRSNPETGLKMAIFYLDHDKHLPEALKLAEKDAGSSEDIPAWDTLAWAYYKNGKYEHASSAMKKALRLGTKDAGLLFHAGMISYRLGNEGQARKYLTSALSINPYFDLNYPKIAWSTLRQIDMHRVQQAQTNKRIAIFIPGVTALLLLGVILARRIRVKTAS